MDGACGSPAIIAASVSSSSDACLAKYVWAAASAPYA